MNCNGCVGEYTGLGQIDAGAVAGIFVHAKDLWDDLVKALGIGAGRREADIITPLQNQVVAAVIAPATDYLTNIRNNVVEPDCAQLKSYQTEVLSAERQWLTYLHSTKWQDGRAAVQAEATLQPYWANLKTGLTALITSECSSIIGGSIGDTISNILKTPDGGVNWPVIAVVGGIGYMLLKRK